MKYRSSRRVVEMCACFSFCRRYGESTFCSLTRERENITKSSFLRRFFHRTFVNECARIGPVAQSYIRDTYDGVSSAMSTLRVRFGVTISL